METVTGFRILARMVTSSAHPPLPPSTLPSPLHPLLPPPPSLLRFSLVSGVYSSDAGEEGETLAEVKALARDGDSHMFSNLGKDGNLPSPPPFRPPFFTFH